MITVTTIQIDYRSLIIIALCLPSSNGIYKSFFTFNRYIINWNVFHKQQVFNILVIFCERNVLVAIGKGIWTVNLCLNKMLQFLVGGASQFRSMCIFGCLAPYEQISLSSRRGQ